MKIAKRNIVIEKKIIYVLFPLIVIIAKAIRYTILKETLVDRGIGYTFIELINNNLYNTRTSGETLTVIFFDLINFFNLSTYFSYEMYITIIWNLILFFIIFKLNSKLSLLQFLFIIASTAVLNIFDFCLAKEPLQMLFFIAMYIIIVCRKITYNLKAASVFFIYLLISLFLREYYVLMAFFFMVIFIVDYLINKFKIKKYRLTIGILCLILSIFLLLILSSIFIPNQYDKLVRNRTNISNASTDIHVISENQENTNMFILLLDYIIVCVRLMFPIELIPLGIKYFPYVFYQILITYLILKSVRNIKENDKNKKLALFSYIAFLIGSAMFEPDFGSWIRHEAVFFMILCIVFGMKTTLKKDEGSLEENKE